MALGVRFQKESGPVAQRSEQRTHNPLVPGSNPGGPTNCFQWLSLFLLTGRFWIVPNSVPCLPQNWCARLLFEAPNRSLLRLRADVAVVF